MKLKKKFLAFFSCMMILVLFFTSGCSANESAESDTESSESTAVSENQEWQSEFYDAETMDGESISMYGVTDNIIPVLEAFESDTGITVDNLTLKNGEILERIKNEHDAGMLNADIWFTGGADAFIAAAEDGLLMPYSSPEAADIAANMKDEDGYWTGTSLTVVNWVVNTEIIEELGIEKPAVWDDLLQPELKGMVSMSNPATSGTAYNTISAIIQTKGEEEGWTYLEQLVEQVPFFTDRGSDPENHVVSGEAAVGINAGTGNVALTEDYANVEVVYPEDGTGWWPQPAAILDGTKNEDMAKVFIDWLLSERGLAEVGKAQNAAVVKENVESPEGILDLNDIELFETDFKVDAAQRESLLTQWEEVVNARDAQ